jgi:hypothetical protein
MNYYKLKSIYKSALALMVLVSLGSCTDLELEETDSINAEAFEGVADPGAFIEGMYNNLNNFVGDQANLFALSEVTTEEFIIPTRGADWGDNGIWRQMHQHNWPANHAFIGTVFNQWNGFHFSADQLLSELTTLTPEQTGQAQFFRALGVWVILDNFGQVPVRNPQENLSIDPVVLTGEEAATRIISDLEAAITNLATVAPGGENNVVGKSAARYLLAKVLLNRHIYNGGTPAGADMQRVVELVNAIEADGYGLESGYFDIFRDSPDNETIFFLTAAVGNRIWNGLHYNMAPEIAGGGWNGFSTLAEFYDLFEGPSDSNLEGEGQEERRGFVPTEGIPFTGRPGTSESGNFPGFEAGSNVGNGFLIGQQFEIDGTPLNDRPGNPLVFRRDYTDNNGTSSIINNDENTGIRVIKYNPTFGGFTGHEVFFRFADAHLMRAEAILRGAAGDALAEVNELRLIRNASPLGSLTEQELLDERGRELYEEIWRRNDLIRFGQFTRDWELKDPAHVGDETRNLFPIPADQVILNPNLVQNPGY